MKLLFKIENFFKVLKSKKIKKIAKVKFKKDKEKFQNCINNMNFTEKWFMNNFEVFNYYLPNDRSHRFKYLEIGAFEGLSIYNVLFFYKNCFATAIDIWSDPNFNSEDIKLDHVTTEKHFDKNMKRFSNFEKRKGDSVIKLRELIRNKSFYDIIYIDGSHNGEDVLSDALDSFKILNKNGIMIFDDATPAFDSLKKYQTYEGIITFLRMFKKEIKIKYIQNILVLEKISE